MDSILQLTAKSISGWECAESYEALQTEGLPWPATHPLGQSSSLLPFSLPHQGMNIWFSAVRCRSPRDLFQGPQLLVGPTHWAVFSPSSGPCLPSWQERGVGLSADIRDVRSSHTSSSLSEAMNVSIALPPEVPGKRSTRTLFHFPVRQRQWRALGVAGGDLETWTQVLPHKRPREQKALKAAMEAAVALPGAGLRSLTSQGAKPTAMKVRAAPNCQCAHSFNQQTSVVHLLCTKDHAGL